MSKHTQLYAQHVAAGAVMVDFAGWEMPLNYGSQLIEHEQVRHSAGMFDVSHMGIVDITGEQSQEFLAVLLANDIYKLDKPGKALYSCMLNIDGGVIDDLIVYFIQNNNYRLIVNASTTAKDLNWIKQQAIQYQVEINLRTDLSIIAVQGPESIAKVCSIVDEALAANLLQLNKFTFLVHEHWIFARTGYTGEDGIEIILPNNAVEMFWQKLSTQGVHPIGLGARDTLRLEAGLNLYGNDMDENVTPLESNLSWTVNFDNEDRNFTGRSALLTQIKSTDLRHLVGVVLKDKGVLRHGQNIFSAEKNQGIITSGTYSPTLGCSIGLGRVALPLNNDYCVEIRGKKHPVCLITPPFVKKGQANFKLV